MSKNSKGFSVVEGLLLFVIIGLLTGVGWYVVHANKNSNNALNNADKSNKVNAKLTTDPSTETTLFDFKKLGITMDILPGWTVKSSVNKRDGSDHKSYNAYSWTISKDGADGEINLISSGFIGGFEDCGLALASIKDVAATKKPNLMFISYTSESGGKTTYSTTIALAEEAKFKAKNDELAPGLKNINLSPGNYYHCSYYPGPGWDLGLSDEDAAGYSRRDVIAAYSASGSAGLSSTSRSYNDIKAMLTSIQ